jgi:hypothetical protein
MNGAVLSTVTLDDFWAPVGSLGGTFDPNVLHDAGSDRWIIVACDNKLPSTSGVLVGVSEDPDPTHSWFLYKVSLGAFSAFADRPSIGVGNDFIVVQVNIIDGTTFFGSRIYSFFKSDLLTGGAGSFGVIALADTFGGSQVPAMGSSSSGTMYLLQTWNGNDGGKGWLRIWILGQVLTPGPFVSIPNTWDRSAPGGANLGPQLNSNERVDLGDDRILNGVYCLPGIGRDYLYAVHTVFLPSGGLATRSAIQVWGLRTDGTQAGSSVEQLARFDDPTGATCFAYPSIAVHPVTHSIVAGFSSFSATRFPSAEMAFRWGSDPLNTLQAGGIFKAGEGAYHRTGVDGRNRWGDYSSTVFDSGSIWTLQEFSRPPQGTGDGSGRWGTWWTQFELFEIP